MVTGRTAEIKFMQVEYCGAHPEYPRPHENTDDADEQRGCEELPRPSDGHKFSLFLIEGPHASVPTNLVAKFFPHFEKRIV